MITRFLLAFGLLGIVGGIVSDMPSGIIVGLICWAIVGFMFYRKRFAKF